MSRPTALIIGAGPAGLTAAYELLSRTPVKPIVIEATDDVGGISRTVNYKGNRIDIGGHRFFSKSDRVMRWWLDMLPMQRFDEKSGRLVVSYQNQHRDVAVGDEGPDPETTDDVMLVRHRTSRILYGGKLYNYPLSLSFDTVRKLGFATTARFGLSYARARVAPIRPERSLEDFFINRFGRDLYDRFFRDYTEKVWGVPCDQISPEWGAQRVKGLSITKVLAHALRSAVRRRADVAQRDTETSLIERFLYPKYGPGQMWQRVADRVRSMGGEVRMETRVDGLTHEDGRITGVRCRDAKTGREDLIPADYVLSTMPVRSLVAGLAPAAPADVKATADGLMYRDFMTAGLLLDRIKLGGGADGTNLAERVPDNWIYVQEPGVKVGRLQFFNNWSPYMVADPTKVWVGLEYFCAVDDSLWSLDDDAFLDLAVDEMVALNLIDRDAVKDRMVVRMPKAYPAYFGTYDQFPVVRDYLDGFSNLFLVGRNGMHMYNNQDHSMLAAMAAVDAIAAGGATDKTAIWSVNTEQEYHEERGEDRKAA